KGSGDLDGRSDLYSVGVSLYEMVTGTRPFEGGSDYSVMVAHLEQAPKPPIHIDPTLLPALNEIILTAIQKDRENRFQSAQAFRAALESVAPSLGQPARPPMPVAAPKPAPLQQAPPAPPLPPPPLSATLTQPVPVVRPQQPSTMPQSAPLLPPLPTAPQVVPPPPPLPPPVAWAEPPVAAAAQAQGGGHRGLWMALGGLIVLVLLAGAAIQGPRWYRTWAAGRGQSATPAATPEPAHAPADATAPAEPAATAVPVPPAAVPAATAAPVVVAPPHTSHPASGHPARADSSQPPPSSAQPPQPVAPPQPPAPPAVDTGRLEELRDRLGTLGPRANAIRSSLDKLERRQQAAGYGLRGDIAASRQRMEYLLDEAQAALNAGNPDRAQKNLDLAEQEADKLDKFLGR
ncbi:MAG TPA: hypothetical protein VN893_07470, partial [Bryobacteraceae bacterium]|nr:hypothetical protein [Bryobacteraceae bacterium]